MARQRTSPTQQPPPPDVAALAERVETLERDVRSLQRWLHYGFGFCSAVTFLAAVAGAVASLVGAVR